ncbi:hypothetical protein [Polaribacter porphyrae]|uniref:Lipocalin-like domain-containing protein n=1 Tax=Polaribacter porphyrae TaxID=1137780 RepID=A0A2S7WQS7_9FLAO|nr:hypothetical protein [Polaribacter porphyrae]PQJ79934.1 hypothetical protein BTO18_12475 [Polaribacter porphyrae]
MKFSKILLIAIFTISLIGCGSDNSEPPFLLSNANLAGTYNIGSLTAQEKEDAKAQSGSVVNLSTTNVVGDIFQLDFVLNANGNYTAKGSYSITSTINDANGGSTEEKEIINVDASGSYQLNTTSNTISFNPTTGDFIEGSFTITTFNETSITLTQDEIDDDGSFIYTTKVTVMFTRN